VSPRFSSFYTPWQRSTQRPPTKPIRQRPSCLDNITVVPVDYLDFSESRAAEVFSRIGSRPDRGEVPRACSAV
jgi:hypothetical protein